MIVHALVAILLLGLTGCGAGLFAGIDPQNVGGQTRVTIELPTPPDADGKPGQPIKLVIIDAKDRTDFALAATFACPKDGAGIQGAPEKIRPCSVTWTSKASMGSNYATVLAEMKNAMTKAQADVGEKAVEAAATAVMRLLAPPIPLPLVGSP